MRLIDADKLKKTFCAECGHTIKCEDCDIDYHFENLAPTIEERPKSINLNDTVKVKLTEAGVKQYKKKIKEWFGEVTPMEVENYIREADSKGYTEFQLWEYMNIFGELFLYPTFEKERLPIENNTLYLICGAEMEVEDE